MWEWPLWYKVHQCHCVTAMKVAYVRVWWQCVILQLAKAPELPFGISHAAAVMQLCYSLTTVPSLTLHLSVFVSHDFFLFLRVCMRAVTGESIDIFGAVLFEWDLRDYLCRCRAQRDVPAGQQAPALSSRTFSLFYSDVLCSVLSVPSFCIIVPSQCIDPHPLLLCSMPSSQWYSCRIVIEAY